MPVVIPARDDVNKFSEDITCEIELI